MAPAGKPARQKSQPPCHKSVRLLPPTLAYRKKHEPAIWESSGRGDLETVERWSSFLFRWMTALPETLLLYTRNEHRSWNKTPKSMKEEHKDVAEDREHEKEDMGLKLGKALVLLYPTLSVWLQRALTKDSKAVHGDT